MYTASCLEKEEVPGAVVGAGVLVSLCGNARSREWTGRRTNCRVGRRPTPSPPPSTDFRFRPARPRGELRNGARWCGIGIGNRLSSLCGQSSPCVQLRLCACCSLPSPTTLRRYPAYARRRPGTLSQLRAMPYPPRERCTHTHTYTYTRSVRAWFFSVTARTTRISHGCACENRSAATSRAGGTARVRERRRKGRERGKGGEKRKETHRVASASTPPGRGSSFLGRPLARSVTGSTGILLERCVAIVANDSRNQDRPFEHPR